MWKKWFFLRKLCSETLEIRGQILPNIFEGFGIKIGVKKNFEIFPFWQSHLHIVVKFRGKLRLRVTGQLLAYVQGATISNGFKIGPFVGSLWFFKVLPNLLPYCPLNWHKISWFWDFQLSRITHANKFWAQKRKNQPFSKKLNFENLCFLYRL